MAITAAETTNAATVGATFTRKDGELRVVFHSESIPSQGFALSELDALFGAIVHARKRMLEDKAEHAITLSTVDATCGEDLGARYRLQLEQMHPVPT